MCWIALVSTYLSIVAYKVQHCHYHHKLSSVKLAWPLALSLLYGGIPLHSGPFPSNKTFFLLFISSWGLRAWFCLRILGLGFSWSFLGFGVKSKIYDVAYRLTLLQQLSRAHNVFLISMLKQYVPDPHTFYNMNHCRLKRMQYVCKSLLKPLTRRNKF